MKRWLLSAAALGLLCGAGSAFAKTPAGPPDKERQASCSGDFGTSVEFMSSPTEAAKWAKKEGKLVLVLHISGHFEDPTLT